MINRMTPQELREQIAEIASRVNDPASEAYYQVETGLRDMPFDQNGQAQDDLLFLLDLIDQLSPECFELTSAGREALGDSQ
jgi:hypothetical protein